MTSATDVLALARTQLGVTESPAGTNRTPYGAAYGLNGAPWCAIWIWWLFHDLDADKALPEKTAGVYALMAAFKRVGRFYSTPQVGDIVIYDFGQGHTGILESFTSSSVSVLEGNTSASSTGSQDNGGMVARKIRPRNKHILGYCRPNYGSTPAPLAPVNTQENDMHDAARTIRWQDGSTSEVTEDGAILHAGIVPSFGSFYSLTAAEKQNVPNPPSPYSLTPARTVQVKYETPDGKNVIVDLPDKNGGTVAWIIGKDGKPNAFKFDADFARTHKV